MAKYKITAICEDCFEVEADNSAEAYKEAISYMYQLEHGPHLSNWNYEIEEVEEEVEENEEDEEKE